MTLAHAPRTPNPDIFIQVASPTIPSTWKQYLARAATGSLAA
jgi:hypothetical protein